MRKFIYDLNSSGLRALLYGLSEPIGLYFGSIWSKIRIFRQLVITVLYLQQNNLAKV